ncbi:hypothetical protein [Natrialbaceae archaeon AArc-T1-2]|uniref:hypothetical protein n=1 Tax=Natrialbaceae archaeon AArc-T1-2 TaxID=3053904 RepID=UPI00255B3FBD|nr:hypothetical protein [Natrialbaceae archaeon AArc-T1-2]WIV65764.1 hypothetical protein QQ977_08595 [Natrialbaceae archaeon AArc-T1-2]
MTRILTVVAVGLIVLGAVAMAGPTFGFSTIASDRGVQVSTAEGEDAYLGMVSTDNEIDNEDGVEVATLYNNLYSDMDSVEVEVDIENDDDELETIDPPSEIGAEDDDAVEVACEEVHGNGGEGEATITVTVEAVANGVTITDASLEDEFEYDCHPGDDPPEDPPGQGDDTPGNGP